MSVPIKHNMKFEFETTCNALFHTKSKYRFFLPFMFMYYDRNIIIIIKVIAS